MNMEKFLKDTLQSIGEMSVDDFEQICLKHGYHPVRTATAFTVRQVVETYSITMKLDYKVIRSSGEVANDESYSLLDCDMCDAA